MRDDVGGRGATPVTWLLVAAWVVAFVIAWRLPDPELARLHATLGLRPAAWLAEWRRLDGLGSADSLERALRLAVPLVGYKLCHGGVVHLLANTLFFPLFAGRLEARAGSLRFLLFHEIAGAAAALAAIAVEPESRTLALGASGAVAASVLAYLVLHWRSRVTTVVPVVVVPVPVTVPPLVPAALWAALQVPPVTRFLEFGPGEPTPWPALAAGGTTGLTALPLVWWRPRRRER